MEQQLLWQQEPNLLKYSKAPLPFKLSLLKMRKKVIFRKSLLLYQSSKMVTLKPPQMKVQILQTTKTDLRT